MRVLRRIVYRRRDEVSERSTSPPWSDYALMANSTEGISVDTKYREDVLVLELPPNEHFSAKSLRQSDANTLQSQEKDSLDITCPCRISKGHVAA